jgi:hypothetical protein
VTEIGELVIQSESHVNVLFPEDSSLWLTTELLDALFRSPEDFTHMSLTLEQHRLNNQHWCMYDPTPCFHGSIVKITNGETKWVYKVFDYDLCKDAWHARWPD